MIAKCWTGRKWLNVGRGFLAIGFGPGKLIERIYWRKRLVWFAKR